LPHLQTAPNSYFEHQTSLYRSQSQTQEQCVDVETHVESVGETGKEGDTQLNQLGSDKDMAKETDEADEQSPGPGNMESESQGTAISTSASSIVPPQSTLPTEPSSSQGIPSSQDATSTVSSSKGYLANRRSASFVRQREDSSGTANTDYFPPRKLNRAGSSLIRLSMTEDGLAKVVDRAASSPSPPPQNSTLAVTGAPRYAGLRRSYSAAGLNDLFKYDGADNSVRKLPRVPGRSRHSSNWTLFCDSDVRDSKELIERAEQEASGSACDAIKMMRKTSRPTLRTNLSRTNTPVLTQGAFAEPKKQPRQPLKRASTTHGRLEKQTTMPPNKGKKGEEEEDEWEMPNTDSDKENWEPEDGQSAAQLSPRRRAHATMPTARSRKAILGENTASISQSASLGAMMDREKKQRGRKQVEGEVGVYVDDAATPPVARGADLDCVASLLSLSQGAWR
jgi:hypothetical protein